MKTSVQELANLLNKLIEDGCGDYDLIVDVRDHYGTKSTARFSLYPDSHINMGHSRNVDTKTIWLDTDLNEDYDGKLPKVTYRRG